MKFIKREQLFSKSIVSWPLYVVTFGVAIISLISTAFPALILRSVNDFENFSGINPFEPGFYFLPLIIVNLSLLFLGILHHKEKLPKLLKQLIKFTFNFEISRQVTFLIIIILIGLYLIFTVEELFNGEYFPDYYIRVQERLENYDPLVIGEYGIGKHVGIFFDWAGLQIFGIDKVAPLLSSVFLLVMTYFLTAKIANKRFSGIIAMVIMASSGLFRFYDTSIAYPNHWIAFYLLSLYLLFSKWQLSPLSYIFSLMSKGLSLLFLPSSIFFIYNMNIPKAKKLLLVAPYLVITLIGMSLILSGFNLGPAQIPYTEFEFKDFLGGFGALNAALRNDPLVLLFLPSLIVGLFIISKKGIIHADSITFMILIILMHSSLLIAFSDHHNVMYRMMPIIPFFAMGVGLIFSKRPTRVFQS